MAQAEPERMRGVMFSCVATQHRRPTAQQNSSAVHLPIISHLLRCDLRVSFHLSPKLQLFPCTVLGERARRPKRVAVSISILPNVLDPSSLLGNVSWFHLVILMLLVEGIDVGDCKVERLELDPPDAQLHTGGRPLRRRVRRQPQHINARECITRTKSTN